MLANSNDDEDDEDDNEESEDDDLIIIPPKNQVIKSTKPVMSEEVESDVLNALAQFHNKDKWKQWGMDELRDQGPSVLFKGPPGTGKTTIAKWMAKKVRKGWKVLDVGALSSGGEPGAMEKQVRLFFADARKRGNMTIAIDECDHILGNRAQISGDALTWMLGTIETLMTEMNQYKGLVLCMTNHDEKLDPALADRFMSIIHVDTPDMSMRKQLWKLKLPARFPFKPSLMDMKALAKPTLTGRQIETVILNVASYAIRTGKKPDMEMFKLFIAKEQGKHLGD